MSFLSDKDVRKGAVPSKAVAKKPAQGSGGGVSIGIGAKETGNDSLVERARIDREQRKMNREHSVYAIKIQAWWRGRATSWRIVKSLRTDVDKKLADIEKLGAVLLTTTKVAFVPPVPIGVELARKLTAFGYHGNEDAQRIVLYCRCVLQPSLREMDPAKNIATSFSLDRKFVLAHRICSWIVFASCSSFKKSKKKPAVSAVDEATISSVLLPCLRLLIGGGAPFRIQYCRSLADAFAGIRIALMGKGQLFRRYRALLTLRTDAAVSVVPEGDFHLTTASVIKRPTRACVGDVIVSTCMFLVRADEVDVRDVNERVAEFSREIMTVPLLTAILSTDCLGALTRWQRFGHVLEYLHRQQLALPPSAHEVFLSGQWLVGNVASLAPFMDIITPPTPPVPAPANHEVVHAEEDDRDDKDGRTMSDETLERYLLVGVSLLRRFEVPGALQGKGGVVWTRNGVSLNAAGVPAALHEQILSLLSPAFSKALYTRVLLPLRDDLHAAPWALTDDRREINEALSSSGLAIARAVIEHQQDASTYFTSKWAQKMMKSMGKSLRVSSAFSSSSSKGSAAPRASPGETPSSEYESLLMNEAVTDTLPPTEFEENLRLVAAVGGLWALILPHAATASNESRAWKALSSLAFGTQAATRLWVAVLRYSVPYEGASHSAVKVQAPPRTPPPSHSFDRKGSGSGSITSGFLSMFGLSAKSEGGRGGNAPAAAETHTQRAAGSASGGVERFAESAFNPLHDLSPDSATNGQVVQALLVALAAILRMILSATDDSEIYEGGRPLPLIQVLRLVRAYKMVLFRTIRHDPSVLAEPPVSSATDPIDLHHIGSSVTVAGDRLYRYGAVRSISAVLSDLYTRWARRPFSASTLWEIEQADTSTVKGELRQHTPFAVALLRIMPWSVDFHERMKIFREVVDRERVAIQGNLHDHTGGQRSKGVVVSYSNIFCFECVVGM